MERASRLLLWELCRRVGHSSPLEVERKIDQWAEVLGHVLSDLGAKVVELGAGMSPKVVFALHECGFRGSLVEVDLTKTALRAQQLVGRMLGVKYDLVVWEGDLFAYDLSSGDVVVASHLLDDLVAGRFAQERGMDYGEVFNDPEVQKKFWAEVGREGKVAVEVVAGLGSKLATMRSGARVVMNEYLSNFDRKYDIRKRHLLCRQLLGRLGMEMEEGGFRKLETEQSLIEGEWLVMERVCPKR